MSSCRHDPVRALVPVLTAMPAAGILLGDVLADSGYAHRDPGAGGRWPYKSPCSHAMAEWR